MEKKYKMYKEPEVFDEYDISNDREMNKKIWDMLPITDEQRLDIIQDLLKTGTLKPISTTIDKTHYTVVAKDEQKKHIN